MKIFSGRCKALAAASLVGLAALGGFPAGAQQGAMGPPATWQAPFPGYAADFIHFVDERRILAGSVELGSAEYAAPQYGKIVLYDAASGQKLWEAGRANLPRGDYSLVVTGAALVLLASEAGRLELSAHDPASGARLWQHSLKAPAHVEAAEDGSLLALSMDASRYRLERLDAASGRRLWSRPLDEPLRERAPSPALHLEGDDVLVVGRRFTRLAGRDGSVKHTVQVPLGDGSAGESMRVPGGLLAWDAGAMVMLDAEGKPRWSHAVEAGAIKQVMHGGERAYRLLGAPDGDDARELLQALAPASGLVEWSQAVPGAAASALVAADGLLVFTVDDAIVGLDAKSGALRFRSAFPDWFHQATPSAVGARGQRDLLQLREGNVYVARERAGVAAYALGAGRALWAQPSYEIVSGIHPTHSTVASATRLRGLLMAQGGRDVAPLPQNFFGVADTSMSRMYIRSAEQRIQNYELERLRAVAQRDTGKAIKLGNLQSVEMTMQRFHGQMAAAQSILSGSVALGEFLARAVTGRMWDASTAPRVLELRNASRLHRGSFQEGYYLRPFMFYGEGRGLTIVELATGKRHDLLHTPHEAVPPWLNLPAFAVGGGSAPRLYAVGAGFDAGRREFHVVRGARTARPSVLAYDLSALAFVDKNERLETQLAGIPASWKTTVPQWAGHCNTFHVRRGLDAAEAAGQDARGIQNAALIFAAMDGCIDVIGLLLKRGADVNAANQAGRTALDLAADESTRQFLVKAGGRSGVKPR